MRNGLYFARKGGGRSTTPHFCKTGKRKEPYKTRFPACWFGEEYPKATYNSTWQKKNQIFHPTVKNTEFLSWLIQLSSMPGELIFDGYMGTGSTALAAIQTGRLYLGTEIQPEYYALAKRRIQEVKMPLVRKGSDSYGTYF